MRLGDLPGIREIGTPDDRLMVGGLVRHLNAMLWLYGLGSCRIRTRWSWRPPFRRTVIERFSSVTQRGTSLYDIHDITDLFQK